MNYLEFSNTALFILQFYLMVIIVKPMELNERHIKHQRIIKWTDKYARDSPNGFHSSERRNNENFSQNKPSDYNGNLGTTNSLKTGPGLKVSSQREMYRNDTKYSSMTLSGVVKRTPVFGINTSSPSFCHGILPNSRICDPSDILKPAEEKKLRDSLDMICNNTGCPCGDCSFNVSKCSGYRVAVLVLATSADEERQYTYNEHVQLAKSLRADVWQYGKCDEDVLVIVDTHLSQIFTSIGHKAAEKLTPQCTGEVLFDAQKLLNDHKFGQVLTQILRDFRKVFLDDFKCVIEREYILPTGHIIAIIFGTVCIPIMVCVISVFLGPCFRGSGFGGKRHKTTYSKYRYQAQNFDKSIVSNTQPEDSTSLCESGRYSKGFAMESGLGERRGAAVML